METNIIPGRYQHYKGKHCEVLGIALHSETNEPLVIYKNCEDSERSGSEQLRARPLELFVGSVEVDGKTLPRFHLVDKKEDTE